MAADIVSAIKDGSFPDSEEILSSDIKTSAIPPLLEQIRLAKDDLRKSVSAISKDQAEDVNGWISQAKKVQQDIVRCKEDYRYIVQEHARIEALRSARQDARSKVSLLQDEISFNETLEQQVVLIANTSASLNKADADIRQAQLTQAAKALPDIETTIQSIQSDQARSLLSQTHRDLVQHLAQELQSVFYSLCSINRTTYAVDLAIYPHLEHDQNVSSFSLADISIALESIGAFDDIRHQFTKRLDSLLLPHFFRHSRSHITGTTTTGHALRLFLSPTVPSALDQVNTIKDLLHFVHENTPAKLQTSLVSHIAAQIIPRLIVHWLDASIPLALDELKDIQLLQNTVQDFATWLRGVGVAEADKLDAWVSDILKTWLNKRRATSLDTVRKSLKIATGSTRQVQRLERQTVVVESSKPDIAPSVDDNWAEDWDEADSQKPGDVVKHPEVTEEDGSDAWGFDADDHESDAQASTNSKSEADDNDADAWGWGDDESVANNTLPNRDTPHNLNGKLYTQPKEQDITLTEEYIITDIPDYILEQIGKDMADSHTLQTFPQSYFNTSTSPAAGMQTLPSLVLAMFRATATDRYTTSTTLSRMNLYNDTLYLAQKLSEHAHNSLSSLQADIDILSKFARQTYTAELTTQRTILHDLLDNAQGFISCTVDPYLTQCETAISSTTDYLRTLHAQWSRVLSPSHLAQSIGNLVSSIMSKMIKDIEDMEDIQESESRKLLQFMQQVSKLEDLFLAPHPTAVMQSQQEEKGEQPSISTIALHAPSYLRFQYLEQILDGSLVDIKYLWTDAGLSLEFSAEEVVDLIEALFAESTHRRSAIQVIKSSSGGARRHKNG
ncbi:ribosome biogenesis protein ytm1 [Lithohypha guttulata]|nr:ribosome biogenesis protein ytm1 [Lithohypha guttulata]